MKKIIFAIVCTIVLVVLGIVNVFAERTDYTQSFNFKRGIDALRNNDVDGALKFFTLEVDENTENGFAWVWIAAIEEDRAEYGNALTAVNTSLQYLPQDDVTYMSMAYDIRGDIYLALEDTTNALNDFNRAVNVAPEYIDVYLKLALLYCELGDYNMSDANYENVIAQDKNMIVGYMGLARNEYKQGDYCEALKYCDVAKNIQQDFSPAYVGKADCYIEMKKYDLAIDNILLAIEIDNSQRAVEQLYWVAELDFGTLEKKLISKCKQDNDNTRWTQCLASLYDDRNDYKKAIEQYMLCPELEKQHYVLYRIADCYSLLGQYEEALNYIDLAIAADSTEYDFLMTKADILYDAGRTNEAIEQMTKYIEHFPDYFGGYYRRGFYKDNIGDVQGAIADYTASIALNSSYAYSYLGRADMYDLQGKTELSRADYKTVISLDTIPSYGSCAQYAYLALGDTVRAVEFMNRVIEKEDAPGCYYDAACLYSRMDDMKMSLKMLEMALRKGYKRFAHVKNDDDLANLRNTKEYKQLIEKYR